MRSLDLTDPFPPRDRRHQPEQVKLLAAQGSETDWGELEPLRGTSWEHGIEQVSAESMSNALHGHMLPLLRELGRDPRASARRVSEEEGLCGMRDTCPIWEKGYCHPGGRNKKQGDGPPECYEPPLSPGTDPRIIDLFRTVAQAWREQRHTIVIVGEGFNFR